MIGEDVGYISFGNLADVEYHQEHHERGVYNAVYVAVSLGGEGGICFSKKSDMTIPAPPTMHIASETRSLVLAGRAVQCQPKFVSQKPVAVSTYPSMTEAKTAALGVADWPCSLLHIWQGRPSSWTLSKVLWTLRTTMSALLVVA